MKVSTKSTSVGVTNLCWPAKIGSMTARDLSAVLKQLPPELQREVYDFAAFLLEARTKRKKSHLNLDWAGELKEFRNRHTSLELQKKVLDWWGD
jgi:hypothetical protein